MSLLIVEDIGKSYKIYKPDWQRIGAFFGLAFKPSKEHWVLRNVSLHLNHGDAIGILGLNGAGKSSLLKIVAGTLQATEGTIKINGSVSAILELGMGFNPEASGRKNAEYSLLLMGNDVGELTSLIEYVYEFSELRSFFDQPLRTYSSGMAMRLAFSVATAKRPDLLIIDEALSVGDLYFQHKSFNRIRQIKEEGTALLFVSHDAGSVKALCENAIILHNGQLLFSGNAESASERYTALVNSQKSDTLKISESDNKLSYEYGSDEVELLDIYISDCNNQAIESIFTGESYTINTKCKVKSAIPALTFGFMIKDRFGQDIFGTNTNYSNQITRDLFNGDEVAFKCTFVAHLGPGSYSVSIALVETDGITLFSNYKWIERALLFKVTNTNKDHFLGTTWLPTNICIDVKRGVS